MARNLQQRILKHLQRHGGWVNGGFYEQMAMREGYKGSTASRRLRELENDNEIIRKEKKGKYARSVWYKANRRYRKIPIYLDDGEVVYTKELQ